MKEAEIKNEEKSIPEPITEMPQETFEQLLNVFILPAIKERQEANELENPLNLRAAQVIFFPDNRKPVVRVNSEVKGMFFFRLKPGVSKATGDPILEDDIGGIERINLLEEEDPDCGHITLLRLEDSWTVAWDCRYNKGLSRTHISAAQEYFEAAQFSLSHKNWLSFLDNLFSAAELAAKAILLVVPDEEFKKRTNHRAIHARFNKYFAPGNVDVSQRDTFNKLAQLRYDARYLQQEISLTEHEAKQYVNVVKKMIESAENWAEVEP